MAEILNGSPPAWLESLVRVLVPPACREHVLGDFRETYASPPQYFGDALRTVPFLIASRIRRTSDPVQLLIYVNVWFVLFGGFQSRPNGQFVGWIPAVAPTIAVTLAVILRAAYRRPDGASSRHAIVDAAVAVSCALLSQVAVAVLHPPSLLTPFAAVVGCVATFMTVLVLRVSVPPEHGAGVAAARHDTITVEEVTRGAQQFERRIHDRNRREVLAGLLVVICFGVFIWLGHGLVTRLGCALMTVGALFVIYYIRTRGVAHPVPTNVALSTAMVVHRGELERQRDLLRTVTWWYLFPFVPGMVVLMLGQAVKSAQPAFALRAFGFVLLIGVLTRHMNQRAARKLQQKIDRLTAALEKQK